HDAPVAPKARKEDRVEALQRLLDVLVAAGLGAVGSAAAVGRGEDARGRVDEGQTRTRLELQGSHPRSVVAQAGGFPEVVFARRARVRAGSRDIGPGDDGVGVHADFGADASESVAL